MGVTHLTTFVQNHRNEIGSQVFLDGQRFLVDGSGFSFFIFNNIIVSNKSQFSSSLAFGGSYQELFLFAFEWLSAIKQSGAELHFVFDQNHFGDEFDKKVDAIRARQASNLECCVNCLEWLKAGANKRDSPYRFPVPIFLGSVLRGVLKKLKIRTISIQGEADSAIAKLFNQSEDQYSAILADDSDFFIFQNCKVIPFPSILIRGFQKPINNHRWRISYSNANTIDGNIVGALFTSEKLSNLLCLSNEQLIDMALLCGNDSTKPFIQKSNIHHEIWNSLEIDSSQHLSFPEVISKWLLKQVNENNYTKLIEHPVIQQACAKIPGLQDAFEFGQSFYDLSFSPNNKRLFYLLSNSTTVIEKLLLQRALEGKNESIFFVPLRNNQWICKTLLEPIGRDEQITSSIILTRGLRKSAYACVGCVKVTEILGKGLQIVEEEVLVPELSKIFSFFVPYDGYQWMVNISPEQIFVLDKALNQPIKILYALVTGCNLIAMNDINSSLNISNILISEDPIWKIPSWGFIPVLTLRSMIVSGNLQIDPTKGDIPLTLHSLKSLIQMFIFLHLFMLHSDFQPLQDYLLASKKIMPFNLEILRVACWFQSSLAMIVEIGSFLGINEEFFQTKWACFDGLIFARFWNDDEYTKQRLRQNDPEDKFFSMLLTTTLWGTELVHGEIPTKTCLTLADIPIDNFLDPIASITLEKIDQTNIRLPESNQNGTESQKQPQFGMIESELTELMLEVDEEIEKNFDEEEKEILVNANNSSFTKQLSNFYDQSRLIKEESPHVTLPIDEYKNVIVDTIQKHDIILIEGDTGCGKSSRIPSFILESDPDASVIVTQPRRMAAIGLAKRVASELGTTVGDIVGYRIGQKLEVSSATKITFATSGYLLQRLVHNNQSPKPFTHIVLDEIHETDIDLELLMLILKIMIKKRDLDCSFKLVLMSATSQSDKLLTYFSSKELTVAQPLHVGVMRYPVRNLYLEQIYEEFADLPPFIVSDLQVLIQKFDQSNVAPKVEDPLMSLAVELIIRVAKQGCCILVFMPGLSNIEKFGQILEEKILKKSEAIAGDLFRIMPLHSELEISDQLEVLKPCTEEVRVVISTNIAESSVTIPFVTHVIDFGLHKELYYNQIHQMSVLEPRWISKASAKQRAGRTGRVCHGVVFKMYTKKFERDAMKEFGLSEMLRLPLDRVVLRVILTGFGHVFSALEQTICPPDFHHVVHAVNLLLNSGLIENISDSEITKEIERIAELIKETKFQLNKRSLSTLYQAKFRVSQLGSTLSLFPLDLEVAKLVVISTILGIPCEGILLGAALSSPDPFIHPNLMASKSKSQNISLAITEYLDLCAKVMRARVQFGSNMNSDPFMIINMYEKWRCTPFKSRKSFEYQFGLMPSRIFYLHAMVTRLASIVSKISPSSHDKIIHLLPPRMIEQYNNNNGTHICKTFCSDLSQTFWICHILLLAAFPKNIIQGRICQKNKIPKKGKKINIQDPRGVVFLNKVPPEYQNMSRLSNVLRLFGTVKRLEPYSGSNSDFFVEFEAGIETQAQLGKKTIKSQKQTQNLSNFSGFYPLFHDKDGLMEDCYSPVKVLCSMSTTKFKVVLPPISLKPGNDGYIPEGMINPNDKKQKNKNNQHHSTMIATTFCSLSWKLRNEHVFFDSYSILKNASQHGNPDQVLYAVFSSLTSSQQKISVANVTHIPFNKVGLALVLLIFTTNAELQLFHATKCDDFEFKMKIDLSDDIDIENYGNPYCTDSELELVSWKSEDFIFPSESDVSFHENDFSDKSGNLKHKKSAKSDSTDPENDEYNYNFNDLDKSDHISSFDPFSSQSIYVRANFLNSSDVSFKLILNGEDFRTINFIRQEMSNILEQRQLVSQDHLMYVLCNLINSVNSRQEEYKKTVFKTRCVTFHDRRQINDDNQESSVVFLKPWQLSTPILRSLHQKQENDIHEKMIINSILIEIFESSNELNQSSRKELKDILSIIEHRLGRNRIATIQQIIGMSITQWIISQNNLFFIESIQIPYVKPLSQAPSNITLEQYSTDLKEVHNILYGSNFSLINNEVFTLSELKQKAKLKISLGQLQMELEKSQICSIKNKNVQYVVSIPHESQLIIQSIVKLLQKSTNQTLKWIELELKCEEIHGKNIIQTIFNAFGGYFDWIQNQPCLNILGSSSKKEEISIVLNALHNPIQAINHIRKNDKPILPSMDRDLDLLDKFTKLEREGEEGGEREAGEREGEEGGEREGGTQGSIELTNLKNRFGNAIEINNVEVTTPTKKTKKEKKRKNKNKKNKSASDESLDDELFEELYVSIEQESNLKQISSPKNSNDLNKAEEKKSKKNKKQFKKVESIIKLENAELKKLNEDMDLKVEEEKEVNNSQTIFESNIIDSAPLQTCSDDNLVKAKLNKFADDITMSLGNKTGICEYYNLSNILEFLSPEFTNVKMNEIHAKIKKFSKEQNMSVNELLSMLKIGFNLEELNGKLKINNPHFYAPEHGDITHNKNDHAKLLSAHEKSICRLEKIMKEIIGLSGDISLPLFALIERCKARISNLDLSINEIFSDSARFQNEFSRFSYRMNETNELIVTLNDNLTIQNLPNEFTHQQMQFVITLKEVLKLNQATQSNPMNWGTIFAEIVRRSNDPKKRKAQDFTGIKLMQFLKFIQLGVEILQNEETLLLYLSESNEFYGGDEIENNFQQIIFEQNQFIDFIRNWFSQNGDEKILWSDLVNLFQLNNGVIDVSVFTGGIPIVKWLKKILPDIVVQKQKNDTSLYLRRK